MVDWQNYGLFWVPSIVRPGILGYPKKDRNFSNPRMACTRQLDWRSLVLAFKGGKGNSSLGFTETSATEPILRIKGSGDSKRWFTV